MRTNRIIATVALTASMFPLTASGQSYWMHSDCMLPYDACIAAATSQDYVAAAGNRVVRSRDGGKTWQLVLQGQPTQNSFLIVGIVHPTPNLIVIAADSESSKGANIGGSWITQLIDAGIIGRSTDGGSTWNFTMIGSLDTDKPHNQIAGIAALDSNHLFLPVMGDHYLISNDGGVTWQQVVCPVKNHLGPWSGNYSPIASYPAPGLLVAAETDTSQNKRVRRIYRSTDLGQTWSSGFLTFDILSKFSFSSADKGFATSISGSILKTLDSGLTWTYDTVLGQGGSLQSIAFADSMHGIVVGLNGIIMRTRDGGHSWTSEYPDFSPGNDSSLIDVAFPTDSTAVIMSGNTFGVRSEALVYKPNGILGLPNITYPAYARVYTPSSFDATWDPVPGADSYWLKLELNHGADYDTVVLVDSNIVATSYHLSGLHSQTYYVLYIQARSSTNQSNIADRQFQSNGLNASVAGEPETQPEGIRCYPNPAASSINVWNAHGVVMISDALGRSYDCPRLNGALDLSRLPVGVYYVGDGATRARFVKE